MVSNTTTADSAESGFEERLAQRKAELSSGQFGQAEDTANHRADNKEKVRATLGGEQLSESPEDIAYDREMQLLKQREETARMEGFAELKKIERLKLELQLAGIKS